MNITYIGLGKMGMNMATRMLEKKHRVNVFDVNQKAVRAMVRKGARGSVSIDDLMSKTTGRKFIWIMVPYKFVDDVLKQLKPYLKKGDVVVDGGNSPYKDSMKRAKKLSKRGIEYLDIGVSGGPHGARNGACMMIGGKRSVYKRYEKLFADLNVKDGFGYMGTSGSGHLVKMVHNGIEYGMMQAIAEGFAIMKASKKFKLNMREIARVYAHGSVIESRLMDWLVGGYKKYGENLQAVSKTAIGTGEGKWTTKLAHELGIKDNVIHEAFLARKRSQKSPNYQAQIIMAIRNGFGGHDINPKKK